MCRSWVGRKAVLQLNSDDELGRILFGLAEIPAPLFQSVLHKEIDTNANLEPSVATAKVEQAPHSTTVPRYYSMLNRGYQYSGPSSVLQLGTA